MADKDAVRGISHGAAHEVVICGGVRAVNSDVSDRRLVGDGLAAEAAHGVNAVVYKFEVIGLVAGAAAAIVPDNHGLDEGVIGGEAELPH